MEFAIERKINLIHAGWGLLTGIFMGISTANNDEPYTFVSIFIIGAIFSYPLMFLVRKSFNLSNKEFTPKDWLLKGYLYFMLVFIIVWTFVFNIL